MPKRSYDWAAIQAYYDEGHGFVECQARFGFSHTAWVKAIRRGRLLVRSCAFPDRRRRYDWAAIQAYYDEGHSVRDCVQQFGFFPQSWDKARKRGEIRTRPSRKPLDILLSKPGDRKNVKLRLLQEGVIQNRCESCGISEWLGRPLAIQIDHINGNRLDHRLDNLRMLCPNCHSQTETFGARNKRRLRLQGVPRVV